MLPLIGSLVKSVSDIVDEVTTSDEERAEARRKLVQLQIEANQKLLEYEAERLRQGAETVRAEVHSNSWLGRSWRPLTMLTFLGLIVAHWFGLSADVPTEEVEWTFQSIRLGLTGYVGGRTLEKIAPMAFEAFKGRKR